MDVRKMTPEEVEFLGDALKYKKLYEDALLQVHDLQKILVDAEGMFRHGSSLQGTHASILWKTIEAYRAKYAEKRKCECPTLPHREGCDFRKRVAEVKGKYKDGPSPICAACGRGPFEPEYIDADGLCADCAREIDGGIA